LLVYGLSEPQIYLFTANLLRLVDTFQTELPDHMSHNVEIATIVDFEWKEIKSDPKQEKLFSQFLEPSNFFPNAYKAV